MVMNLEFVIFFLDLFPVDIILWSSENHPKPKILYKTNEVPHFFNPMRYSHYSNISNVVNIPLLSFQAAY